jgi:UDP-GlcNAc:undecaprenyl-phosphate GlcNAc-1-phosphate transferase
MLAVAAVAATATVLLTPVVRRLSIRLDMVDRPGGRRLHTGVVPRGGGLAIAAVFLAGTGIVVATLSASLVAENPDAPRLVRGLMLAGLLAAGLGWIDDLRDLSPSWQLAGQLAVAGVAVHHRLWLQRFSNPLAATEVDLRAAAGVAVVVAVTVLWYVGFLNTMNWLDGVDGLAAAVGGVAALLFAVHMGFAFQQYALALLPAILAGACVGFLPGNFGRRPVFMGSSGTMFLGATLAALALVAPAKVATALLVMAVPIVDVAWQILYRLRVGRAPWQGDRGHLHHRLFDRGWSPARVVTLYVALSGTLGAVAVLTPAGLPYRPLVKLAALAVVALATGFGLWRLARDDAPAAAPPDRPREP